jgi:hypothetical protein
MANARFDDLMSFHRHRADARIVCGACRHETTLTAVDLSRLFPLSLTIQAAERRLRCSTCGEKRARMIPIPAAKMRDVR